MLKNNTTDFKQYRLKLFYFEMYQIYWSWWGYAGLVHSDSHWQWQQAATGGDSEQRAIDFNINNATASLFLFVFSCLNMHKFPTLSNTNEYYIIQSKPSKDLILNGSSQSHKHKPKISTPQLFAGGWEAWFPDLLRVKYQTSGLRRQNNGQIVLQ